MSQVIRISTGNLEMHTFSVHSEIKKEATVGRFAWRVRSPTKQSSFLGISEGARLDPPLRSPRLGTWGATRELGLRDL